MLVSIGTDHHPFDRLIDWLDAYLERHPGLADQTLVQHGQTKPSACGRNQPFLGFDELYEAMGAVDLVIVHGGPGTIFEARAQGRLPLCVPRDPELGEVVDNHQQRFAEHLASNGFVLLADTQQAFDDTLDEVLADPARARIEADDSGVRATAQRLDEYITTVIATERAKAAKKSQKSRRPRKKKA